MCRSDHDRYDLQRLAISVGKGVLMVREGRLRSGVRAKASVLAKPQRFLSEAMLIAWVTACGYAVAMIYELAYFNFFGIPTYLIALTPSVILRGLLGLGILVMVSTPIISLLERLLRILPSADLRFRLIIAGVFWTGAALTFGIGGYSHLAAVGLFAWILLSFIRAFRKAEGTFWKKFGAAFTADIEEEGDGPVMKAIERRFGVAPILLVFMMYLIGLLAYVSGSAAARFQSDFYVMDSVPQIAIVRMHSDMLIGFEFDEESRRVTGRYVVKRIDDEERATVRSVRLGWFSEFKDQTEEK